MTQIDTKEWKDFVICDFCEIIEGNKPQVPTGAYMPTKSLEAGDIPRITVSNYNNGITGYYSNSDDKNYREYENFISISFLGTVFYHKNKASLDMKVHCVKPKNIILNEYSGLFLATMIKVSLGHLSYADQISSTMIPQLSVRLPMTKDETVDWEYMESYMKRVVEKMTSVLNSLENLNQITDYTRIDTSNWKRFHLYDDELFEINMGSKLDKTKMSVVNPSVNFVGRSNVNNGITACVDRIENIEPYKAGYMTVSLGGEYLGSCFIQPKDFYTSQNVIVLIPKWDMPFSIKQFIATMIFKESRTYYKAFIDELNRHVKTDFTFLLPVDKNGKPDWCYMQNYMCNIGKEMMSVSEKLLML